jgi:hypothetical protein
MDTLPRRQSQMLLKKFSLFHRRKHLILEHLPCLKTESKVKYAQQAS